MSNTKHLADLLKVCSILPALAIMPAMADENKNIVVENTPLTFENMVIDYETTDATSALGVNATGATQVDFGGALTDISVSSTGSPKYTAPVFNRGAGTVINFNSDKTVLSATSANSHIQGVAVNGDGSKVNFNGDLEMNLSGNSSEKVIRGFDVTDDGYVSLDGDVVLNVTGGEDVVEVLGILSSGAKGIDLKSGNSLKINAKGKTSVTGIYSQYGGNIDLAKDTDVDVNVTATDGTARGVFSSYYSDKSGNIDSKGSLDVTVSGSDAIGLSVVRGASADIKHMNIDVKGTNSAKGIYVSDYHEEGDDIGSAKTTDVTVGTEGSTTKIVAKGAGAKESIGIHVKKVEEDVELTLNGDVDIESDGYGVLAGGGAVANIGTEGAKEIEIDALNGVAVYAENGSTVNIGGQNTEEVEIAADNHYAIASVRADSSVSINGKNIDVSTNGAKHVAAMAQDGASLSIGSADTESVVLKAKYIAAQALRQPSTGTGPTSLDIRGKNIEIVNDTASVGAVHVQNSTEDAGHDYTKSATLNITGDNILIENLADDGIAIAARSQGIVNVVGDATIIADSAIRAAGMAQVNINKSGENTVKMLGDINFNYDKKTSGTKVNATVDVTLAGAESFWTGNTKVSYGTGTATDGSYFNVDSAKLTMKDGAVWNATKIAEFENETSGVMYAALNDLIINNGTVNIEDTERGITIDRIVANDATFTGGKLNVNESIDISGEDVTTTFGGNVFGATGATLTLASGATMDIGTSTIKFDTMNIDGTVIASVTNGRPYGHLYGDIVAGKDALLKLNVGSVGTYKIFDGETNMKLDAGLAYNVKYNDEYAVVVETKAIDKLAQDAGISTQAAGAVAGLANSHDATLQKVSLAAQQALNSGDVATVEKETKKLNPTDKPVAQAAAASVQNQVLSLAAGRMSGGISVGRAGGDERSQENGFWIQGLFNKSKFADEFHGYTRGVALGADTLIDKEWTIGGGLAFNNSDVHADGVKTDIDSKTLFLYGQYKPNNWFVNATATYTMSEYTDNKTIFGVVYNDEYDVDSYGAQVMGGYDFATGITTEAGLRYLHVAQEENGFAEELDTNFLSGVAGVKYAFAIENDWAIQLRPELRAAMTYDFISDDASATVVMPGVASYKVDGDRLSRMGGEFGIGLTALYKGMEVSLMYDLDLHEDYTSQTGMIKFRGKF